MCAVLTPPCPAFDTEGLVLVFALRAVVQVRAGLALLKRGAVTSYLALVGVLRRVLLSHPVRPPTLL
jgi:hypothetical protein